MVKIQKNNFRKIVQLIKMMGLALLLLSFGIVTVNAESKNEVSQQQVQTIKGTIIDETIMMNPVFSKPWAMTNIRFAQIST
jgi:hypothetical protein